MKDVEDTEDAEDTDDREDTEDMKIAKDRKEISFHVMEGGGDTLGGRRQRLLL